MGIQNIENSTKQQPPRKESKISSIFNAFSSKKKKKERTYSAELKLNKYETMKIKKKPQQYLNVNTMKQPIMFKSPKINILPQNEHQETHPTPFGKRLQIKTNLNAMRYKDNIDNITKQMLAGSHAERIANKLHNINHSKTIQIVNTNKINVQSLDLKKKQKEKKLKKKLLKKKKEEFEFEEDEHSKYNPYHRAVSEIKKMPQFETPEDKIQCVVRTADIIRDCIDKYHENRRKDPIQITPDDLLSLFAYILTSANLHCLWAEVELIDDFVVDNLRMDMPGYYIATLRAAMQLIVNDIDKLTQTSLKKRNCKRNDATP